MIGKLTPEVQEICRDANFHLTSKIKVIFFHYLFVVVPFFLNHGSDHESLQVKKKKKDYIIYM